MKTPLATPSTPQKVFAAQNAKLGLITTLDLSLLIGVDVARLNSFAKQGIMNHYGEYHGKRFFNFQEVMNWLAEPDDQSEAKPLIRAGIKKMMDDDSCPYSLEKYTASDGTPQVRIVWKEVTEV